MNDRTALARREQLPPYEFGNKASENALRKENLEVYDKETTRVNEDEDSPGFYTGQWALNTSYKLNSEAREMRHGRGTYIQSDGSIYEGYWFYDKVHGHGRKIYENGSMYIGDWIDNIHDGIGKLTQENGETYKGEFQ